MRNWKSQFKDSCNKSNVYAFHTECIKNFSYLNEY
jgi:hypothetical protein